MPRRINRRKARTRANDGDGQQNKKRAGKRELWKCRVCGKRGKPKTGFPLFPRALGNLAKRGEISTFPQSRRRRRMKKWKTKPRFPTFPPPRILSFFRNKKHGWRRGFAPRLRVTE